MINGNLSSDSMAMLLLCSNLAPSENKGEKIKPLTLSEWNKLAQTLANSALKSPKAFLETSPEDWQQELSLTSSQIERFKKLLSQGTNVAIELERLNRLGIWVTTRAESSYPIRLKKLLKQKAPMVIYGAGDINILNTEGVAVVGSRDVEKEGTLFTQRLAHQCAKEGLTVVSGGARGVDQTAQQSALDSGGCVIAVLANGMEANLRKREVRNAILSGHLLLISESHPKARFTVYSAMGRNKYIYTLSRYSVVVSSALEKGGTWAGATENLKSKWVPLIIRSDKNTPAGNNRLLELGGTALHSETLESNQFVLKNWLPKLNVELVNKKETKDIYHIVRPYIEELLTTEKSESELAEKLNVQLSQIKVWLNRAVQDGIIINSANPNFYLSKTSQFYDYKVDNEQISLFDVIKEK
jgi:DNA processing protein